MIDLPSAYLVDLGFGRLLVIHARSMASVVDLLDREALRWLSITDLGWLLTS